jgi:soluble cytochrome b562
MLQPKKKETDPTIKDYAIDIITIKGDIDSIKRHMEERKIDMIASINTLSDIKSTLIGNNMNGNKGIVFLINDIDKRVKDLEKANLEREQTESNAKWIGGIGLTALLSLMIYIVTHMKSNG